MRILLRQIPPAGRSYEVIVQAGPLRERLVNRRDITRIGACRAEVRCDIIDQVVNLRGEVRLDLAFVCSRCADEAEATLRVPLKMVLMPRSHRAGPADEDEGAGFHNGREINLAWIVVDQVALMVPEILLCDPECRGLCPVCNADLNDGPCTCGAEQKG